MADLDHYLDIRIRPDENFSAGQLMGVLFGKLHRALAERQAIDIAVCFPQHRSTGASPFIGETLRLLSGQVQLQALMASAWLVGVRDHIEVGDILPVPAMVQHRVVRRVQTQSNPERLQRRYAQRHNMSVEAAAQLITADHAKCCDLPFVSIRSQSTGQRFRLFIEHGALSEQPIQGAFNTYGLSSVATVPWF
jgi:CRISPR-associated endonuclease Csy4